MTEPLKVHMDLKSIIMCVNVHDEAWPPPPPPRFLLVWRRRWGCSNECKRVCSTERSVQMRITASDTQGSCQWKQGFCRSDVLHYLLPLMFFFPLAADLKPQNHSFEAMKFFYLSFFSPPCYLSMFLFSLIYYCNYYCYLQFAVNLFHIVNSFLLDLCCVCVCVSWSPDWTAAFVPSDVVKKTKKNKVKWSEYKESVFDSLACCDMTEWKDGNKSVQCGD